MSSTKWQSVDQSILASDVIGRIHEPDDLVVRA